MAKPLIKRNITVDALEADGSSKNYTRTLYFTQYGPMLVSPRLGLTWTATKGYAIRDTSLENGRLLDQYLDFAKARSVADVRNALVTHQASLGANTIVVDRAGQAMYTDSSPVPNLDAAKINRCAKSSLAKTLLPSRLFVLDGSDGTCDWTADSRSVTPGLMPVQDMPVNIGTRYFSNSNDSSWLSNPSFRNEISPVIGDGAKAQTLRTRMVFRQLEDRLAGTDGLPGKRFSPDNLEAMFYSSRAMSAELVLDSVKQLCSTATTVTATNGAEVDMREACSVLGAWNGRMTKDSVGVHVFREFWRKAQSTPNLWSVPFDAADPINTPRNPNIADPAVATSLLRALADGVQLVQSRNQPLNAKLGDVQFVKRNGERLPLYGGDECEGVMNKVTPTITADGYTDIVSGGSYVQAVTFDDNGPVARGVLTYSLSIDPASPNYADQTKQVFSQGKWVKFPFSDAEINSDPHLKKLTITE